MLSKARQNLSPFIDEGRLRLVEADALSALRELATGSQHLVASAYAVHNFQDRYGISF